MLKPEIAWFKEEPFFEDSIIANYKVKSIKVDFLLKPDGKPLYKRNETQHYLFNEDGKMTAKYVLIDRGETKTDTSMLTFEYDDDRRVKTKRSSDKFGYFSYNYSYDKFGNVVSELYCRDINKTGSQLNFILDKQYPIGEEFYEFIYQNDKQYKQILFNNLKKPFKEIIVNFNDAGKKIEEYGKYLVTSKIEKNTYTYDSLNRLKFLESFSNLMNEITEGTGIEYDSLGKIFQLKRYYNGIFVNLSEFIYIPSTDLIQDIITRNEVQKNIEIIRFEYEYHQENKNDSITDAVLERYRVKGPRQSQPNRKATRRRR